MSEQDVKAAAERLLGAAREVITDEQHGDEYADGIGYPGLQADLVTVAQFALEAADRHAALALELGRYKEAITEFTAAQKAIEELNDYHSEQYAVRAFLRRQTAMDDLAALDTAPAEAGERL